MVIKLIFQRRQIIEITDWLLVLNVCFEYLPSLSTVWIALIRFNFLFFNHSTVFEQCSPALDLRCVNLWKLQVVLFIICKTLWQPSIKNASHVHKLRIISSCLLNLQWRFQEPTAHQSCFGCDVSVCVTLLMTSIMLKLVSAFTKLRMNNTQKLISRSLVMADRAENKMIPVTEKSIGPSLLNTALLTVASSSVSAVWCFKCLETIIS